MLELGLKILFAYLLGSVVGALLIGTFRGVDIRELGSGNAGGTNALRTQGIWFAAATVAIDVGKGWLSVGWLAIQDLPGIAVDPSVDRGWIVVACAAAAVVGHIWPLYHDFRGGKGGATLVGALLALMPALVPIALATWLVVVLLSGFVGLATIVAAAAMPIATWFLVGRIYPMIAFTLAMAVLVAFAHRSNFSRMRAGSEPRFERLWLFRPRKSS